MPTEASLAEIETAELILAVDDTRAATGPFKLLTPLRTLVELRLADLLGHAHHGGRARAQVRPITFDVRWNSNPSPALRAPSPRPTG